MEGGQKTSIDLEAGLNISTSDMLTPFAQQSFQHNWQKYQGKFLPNSLRFEKNGWAAGWNVYNFDYNTHRTKQNGYYVGIGQLNNYVKTLNVYESESSYNAIHTVYVVPDTVITVGDVSVNGNIISGKIKDKNFQLRWDPVTHTLSCTDPTIELTQVINSDYSVTFTVKDLTNSFSYEFDVLLPDQLTGTAITGVPYDGYKDNVHSWGQYTYNVNTGVLTTPGGVTVSPAVSGNEISFSYTQEVLDETINVAYSLSKSYSRFSDIKNQSQSNPDNLIVATGSNQPAFNKWYATVKPNVLKAGDKDGVIIDCKLPLWITAKLDINKVNPEAKKCDNTGNYEIATLQGTGLNMGGTYTNIWDGEGTFYIENSYRPQLTTKYIKGITHRFNQIFLNNTIALSVDWDYRKHLLNTQVWFSDSRRYSNIRGRRTDEMTALLGNVYTWGTFYVDTRTKFEYNNPYDVTDKDSCIYTKKDISHILSFKLTGAADNSNEGEDQEFVNSSLNIDSTIVAKLSGSVTEYSSAQVAAEYANIYTAGKYTGTTYETVGISEDPFWPFEKVPKFNFKDTDGNIHTGVYWTDGTTCIDNLDAFKAKVLGAYDATVDAMNAAIKENPAYNRQRVVAKYKAGYDFDFISKSSFESPQDYTNAVNAWNEIWAKYYPSTPSPQTVFYESAVSSDNTYLDFNNITVASNVDPMIVYVAPGVYVSDKYAVPYNCPSGLIIFEDNIEYTLSAGVWHHTIQADDQYIINYKHEAGVVEYNGTKVNVPFYFGSATADTLVAGTDSVLFNQVAAKASLSSAKLKLGVNYDCKQVSSSGHTAWDWIRKDPQTTNWLRDLLIYYASGKVTVESASLNTGVEKVQKYYYVGDVNSGIKFAWPVWGHSQTRLTYPEIKDTSHIFDKDTFIFTPVPTAELPNNKAIYFDRNDTDKSQLLFEVADVSVTPDTGIILALNPINNSFIYYAEAKYDTNTKEILADYYIPGIAWGSPDNSTGNMTVTSQLSAIELTWTPETNNLITSALETFSDKNTKYLQHKFYTSDKSLIHNVGCIVGEVGLDGSTQDIILKFPYGDFILHYDNDSGKTTCNVNQLIMSNDTEDIYITAVSGTAENVAMSLLIKLNYKNNKAKFTKVSNYTLMSSDGDKCVIANGVNQLTYSITQQEVVVPESGVNASVIAIPGGQHVVADSSAQISYAGYLKAVYDGKINGSNASFEWQGITFNWDLSKQIDTGISVLSTDIRKPEKTNIIGKLNPEGQYQLLRQQWNTTVEVENYWWVDATHVLELNQYALVLKRNTKALDDWNGERFEKVFEIGRDKILPTNIMKHFVTNVYKSNRAAIFVTVQESLGAILLTFYNPRRAFEVIGTQQIIVRQRDIGQQLNDITISGKTALFNTYNPLTANQLLSKAEWSHTIVGNWMIIGCHLGNNYDQWAFVIDLNNFTLTKCIQGYGYVGLHGDLTGGQIPNDYFDANKGFNDVVKPLSVLKSDAQDINNLDAAYEVGSVNVINQIDAKVVGTGEQQWYITKKLYGIVSHLTFNNGSFTKQLLPITNNYAAIYNSPSFSSSVFADAFVQVASLSSIFTFDSWMSGVWNAIMVLIGYPNFYSIAPRYAQLAYLQQTFGQYAYVHYNSSNSLPEKEIGNSNTDIHSGGGVDVGIAHKQTDPILSSSFTFDKQKFSQRAKTELGYFNSILAVLIASFADSIHFIDKKISINEEINTSAVTDVGRKFVDNVSANTSDMLASAIMTQSKNDSGVTSVVTGIKSLDMFYSTSDQQRVFAGPGFVEHQMVANCVAQSVTDTQVEGKVQQFYFCIRALTTLQIRTIMLIEAKIAEWLRYQAESMESTTMLGTSISVGGLIMKASAQAIVLAIQAQDVALKEIDNVLDTICAKGITVNVDGQVSRHALSVEGKHKYGEKNEVFMWPCFGIQPGQVKYTDEWVNCGTRNTPWSLTLNSVKYYTNGASNANCNLIMSWDKPMYSQNKMGTQSMAVRYCGTTKPWGYTVGDLDYNMPGDTFRAYFMAGNVPFYQASAFGKAEERVLPDDMACVEGVDRFLPNEPFKNENISVSEPAFAPSMIHDFVIDKSWDLAQCATYGLTQWVTVKDTKVTNCPPSNMIVSDTFCGIACPYSAIEVKRGIEKAYMRPWAITPNTLALNCTGYNTIFQDKLYHAFDGISYRMVNLVGSPGMNKNRQSFWYSFQVNDRFKRSNICPANEMQGNFMAEPTQAVDSIDKLYTTMTIAAKEKGLEAGTIGEDKDAIRWAVPVFTEPVSTLPACVKTMTATTLAVVEGVTSLVTAQVTDTNAAYKAPLSVDFTIGKNTYRATEEYICSVQPANAGNIITDIIPSLGLKFIGSTPAEAFFYSKATRCYYTFSGSSLTKVNMMERFRDVQKGYWDFVNQEVVMPCLMTFKRLNEEVEDKDTETDNIIVPVLSKGEVSGELPPPITTIFNDRSWYKCVSLPCGFAYQGPNRVIINRAVFCEYMERSVKDNYNKWKKLSRDKYVTKREYTDCYDNIMKDVQGVNGWTYNPFVLVTSALGQSEDTDCMFEWNITFCWPVEMDLLYGVDSYACVNICAETMTPGGKRKSEVTHVFLTKELFTRNGSYGYYSFRFQSKNGMGNRERLHIWSDQYIAISSVDCESKAVTQRRTEQLTQQVDIQKLKEL